MEKNIKFKSILSQSTHPNKTVSEKYEILKKAVKTFEKKWQQSKKLNSDMKNILKDIKKIQYPTKIQWDNVKNLSEFIPNTYGELKEVKKLFIESHIEMLDEQIYFIEKNMVDENNNDVNFESLSKKDQKTWEKCTTAKLHIYKQAENIEDDRARNHTQAFKKDKKLFKDFQRKMVADIAKTTGIAKKTITNRAGNFYTNQLNFRNWNEVITNISVGDKTYTSFQIPASKMQGITKNDQTFSLLDGYDKGGGVSSLDTTNTEKATNLWISQLKHKGRKLFSAIRFGACCPFGIKDQKKLEEGAINKAKEVLTAALSEAGHLQQAIDAAALLETGNLQQAVDAAENQGVKPPKLEILLTSLLTTGLGSKHERKIQEVQTKAFKKLASQEVIELTVPGPDGQKIPIKFSLQANLINLPVNWRGVGFASWFTSGKKEQLKQNTPVMEYLLGTKNDSKDSFSGGYVSQYLEKIKTDIIFKESDLKKLENEKNLSPTKQSLKKVISEVFEDLQALKRKKAVIPILAEQCKEIFQTGTHYKDNDVYKLTSRLTLLAHQIDIVPMFNCKSGKDRSGMQDAEVKFIIVHYEKYGWIPKPGEKLNEEQKKIFKEVVSKTGNLEIQQYNTAASGYKIEDIDSVDARTDPVTREMIRSFSGMVKA